MLGKIVTVIFLICLGVLAWIIYQNLPGDPIFLNSSGQRSTERFVTYGNTPVFDENMRFSASNVTYYIERNCLKRREKMIEAFNIVDASVSALTFRETTRNQADIAIGCSNDYIELGEDLYAAGEGGPSKIVNTTKFKIIQSGKISLFRSSDCEYPVVELHELFHVLGFDHSPNPKSVMYNTSDCEQQITPDMVTILQKLYSIPSLPDITIQDVGALQKGRYLDFNITVANEGLATTPKNVSLTLYYENEAFEEIDMGIIDVGYGRTLKAENIKMPSRKEGQITFQVDAENTIKEIDEGDNVIRLS